MLWSNLITFKNSSSFSLISFLSFSSSSLGSIKNVFYGDLILTKGISFSHSSGRDLITSNLFFKGWIYGFLFFIVFLSLNNNFGTYLVNRSYFKPNLDLQISNIDFYWWEISFVLNIVWFGIWVNETSNWSNSFFSCSNWFWMPSRESINST